MSIAEFVTEHGLGALMNPGAYFIGPEDSDGNDQSVHEREERHEANWAVIRLAGGPAADQDQAAPSNRDQEEADSGVNMNKGAAPAPAPAPTTTTLPTTKRKQKHKQNGDKQEVGLSIKSAYWEEGISREAFDSLFLPQGVGQEKPKAAVDEITKLELVKAESQSPLYSSDDDDGFGPFGGLGGGRGGVGAGYQSFGSTGNMTQASWRQARALKKAQRMAREKEEWQKFYADESDKDDPEPDPQNVQEVQPEQAAAISSSGGAVAEKENTENEVDGSAKQAAKKRRVSADADEREDKFKYVTTYHKTPVGIIFSNSLYRFPKLEEMRAESVEIRKLVLTPANCPSLETLYIGQYEHSLNQLHLCLPKLKKIELVNCYALRDSDVHLSLSTCTSLELLESYRFGGLDEDENMKALYLPNLREMKCYRSEHMNRFVFYAPNLPDEKLQVEGTRGAPLLGQPAGAVSSATNEGSSNEEDGEGRPTGSGRNNVFIRRYVEAEFAEFVSLFVKENREVLPGLAAAMDPLLQNGQVITQAAFEKALVASRVQQLEAQADSTNEQYYRYTTSKKKISRKKNE